MNLTPENAHVLELMSNAINRSNPIRWLTADEAIRIILVRDTV